MCAGLSQRINHSTSGSSGSGPPLTTAVLGVLRFQHERRRHLHDESLTVLEPGVDQVVEVDNQRVLQPRDAVSVIPFALELEAIKHILAQRERIGVTGMQVDVDVPLRRLLLLASALRLPHNRLVGQGRVPALLPDVVRVQHVSRPGIEQPAVRRIPHQKQIIVGFDVWEAASEIRPDAALRVLFGERPELAGYEHPVAGVEVLMDVVGDVLAERVMNRIPARVVRVADVIHLQLPLDLLDARHRSNASQKSSMYWSAVDHAPIRRRFASRTMSYLSCAVSSGCAFRRFHTDTHDRHGRLPSRADGWS